MAEVWQIPLKDFIGNWPVVDYDMDFENACRQIIEEYETKWVKSGLLPLQEHPNYFLYEIPTGEGVLLILKDKWGDYDVVGGYVEETLWIEPSLRKRGLSTHLVLARADMLGGQMSPEAYTPAGLAAHRSAHRQAIARAKSEGKKVGTT